MPTIEEWYRGIPPITRSWFTASLVTSILFTTGVPMTQYLPLNWDLVLHKFEVPPLNIARSHTHQTIAATQRSLCRAHSQRRSNARS